MKIDAYNKQLESQLSCNITGLIRFALWLCVHSTDKYSLSNCATAAACCKKIHCGSQKLLCFAVFLIKKKKKYKPEKGFREVREFSSFLRNTKTNIFSISSYILFFTSLGWLAISHNNYFHYGKEVLLAVCHVFCFSECSWHCPLAYHY